MKDHYPTELMLKDPLYVLVKVKADGRMIPINVSLDSRKGYSAAFSWEHQPGPDETIVLLKVHHAEAVRAPK